MRSLKLSVKALLIFVSLLSMCGASSVTAQSCGSTGLALQVLGSGGPELQDKRASTSYLIWNNGRARVIVDAGGGSALRFGESGAEMSPVDVFLFSHFHVDHSGDFPALIFSSWFGDRKRPLPIFGPSGNNIMPSTTEFVHDLFSQPHGAWRYLSEMVEPNPEGTYELQPHNVAPSPTPTLVFRNAEITVYAVSVVHGPFPALAWRVEIGGKRIVFSVEIRMAKGKALHCWPRTQIYSSLITPCQRALPDWKGVSICHRQSSERSPPMLMSSN